MSWFSITQHGKSLWDKHTLAKNIITGHIVSDFIFQKGIKNNYVNRVIREVISEVFSMVLAPKLFPYSNEIATKGLNHSFRREKLLHVGARLKQNFNSQNLLTASKTGFRVLKNVTYNYFYKNKTATAEVVVAIQQPSNITSKISTLIKYEPPIDLNQTANEKKALVDCLKKFELNQATNKAMLLSLRPACERAVRAGMVSATKNAGSTAYDFSIKKIVSLISIPLLYNGALTALGWSSRYYVNNLAIKELNAQMVSFQQIVSPQLLLWGITAINAIDMGYIFWSARRLSSNQHEDADREEIKQLAFKYLEAPIAKKLQENAFFNLAGISSDQAQIDMITHVLIDETIDLYWNDLKSQKVLGLPLIS